MSQPLLSIVIANYNYGRFLEEAIESVIAQGMDNDIELIVCDAASTDNSVKVIEKYANGLPAGIHYSDWCANSRHTNRNPQLLTWWCSEPDGGQSAAFNKGFSHARGRFLTWLNADDIMTSGAIKAIIRSIERHADCDWFTGNFFRFTNDGRVIEVGWGPHWYPYWMQRKNSPIVVFGPSSIFSKRLFEKSGGFDVDMHLMMDIDMWVRFMAMGVKQRRISHFIWGFRMHEESKTAEFSEHKISDANAARFKYENARMIAKTGYRCSRFWRIFSLAARMIDGSLICGCYFRYFFRSAHV